MDKIIEFIAVFHYLFQDFPYSQEIEDLKRQSFNMAVKASFGDKEGFFFLKEYLDNSLDNLISKDNFDNSKLKLLKWKLNELSFEFDDFFVFSQIDQNKGVNKEIVNKEINKEIDKGNKLNNSDRVKLIINFFLEKRDNIKFKEIADLFPNITGRTIRNDLASLVEDGFLVQEGRGKGSFYKLAENS
jgi:hypothetical protein